MSLKHPAILSTTLLMLHTHKHAHSKRGRGSLESRRVKEAARNALSTSVASLDSLDLKVLRHSLEL